MLSVTLAEDGSKSCRVTVPDGQLSLAIGNKGQNARLAARLTGWKIDIRPESGFYGEDEDDEAEGLDDELTKDETTVEHPDEEAQDEEELLIEDEETELNEE